MARAYDEGKSIGGAAVQTVPAGTSPAQGRRAGLVIRRVTSFLSFHQHLIFHSSGRALTSFLRYHVTSQFVVAIPLEGHLKTPSALLSARSAGRVTEGDSGTGRDLRAYAQPPFWKGMWETRGACLSHVRPCLRPLAPHLSRPVHDD